MVEDWREGGRRKDWRKEGRTALIKSNNPHLAGDGECFNAMVGITRSKVISNSPVCSFYMLRNPKPQIVVSIFPLSLYIPYIAPISPLSKSTFGRGLVKIQPGFPTPKRTRVLLQGRLRRSWFERFNIPQSRLYPCRLPLISPQYICRLHKEVMFS